MRQPWKLPLAVVCLLALAFVPLLPATPGSAQSVTYTATDVGTLGGAQSVGLGIDGCGKVVGESFPTGSTSNHPFIWNNGTITDLGTFGGSNGTASGVNNAGAVAGSAQSGTSETRPFRWISPGPKTDLGTPGTAAAAYDINESNQIVGQWETSPLQDRAYVWTQATGMQIITAPWGTPIAAYGINNAGDIVGTAETSAGAAHAFFRTGISIIEIGTLGGTNSFAYEVNESAVVVGYANIPSSGASRPFHAFRWTPLLPGGTPQDLGTLGGTRSIAYGVNASGQIVGYSEVAGGAQHAFLWSDDNFNDAPDAGEMKDLNTLAPVAGWTFEEARGINDRGQIVATAVNGTGQRHAFLLTPDNAGPSPCAVPGSLQFSSATYNAAENGVTATITVTRTVGSDGAVSVGYATSNGTATAGVGGDYTATSGTLNWADGETTDKTFTVTVAEDALDETDETVNLTLSGPSGGASLGSQSTAVLTITDNDTTPTLSIGDATAVTEGNSGTVNATFNVTLSAASSQTVTVNYSTADNSAVAPGDYTAVASTQLTFTPGQTSKDVTVAVVGDTTDEVNETFFVNLSGASNATINDGQGVGTINDDDGSPSLSIGDVTVTEGNAGTINATFTVSLLPASGQTVTVNYSTSDNTAVAPGDYTAVGSTQLTFTPGQTSKTLDVVVKGDTTFEANETFLVNLSGATNATLSDNQGTGTITDDDGGSVFQFSAPTYSVGEAGPNVTITVTRTGNTAAGGVSVNYATSNGTATAGVGGDYTAASGTLNFADSETSKTFTVTIAEDTLDEADETVNLSLSSPVGGTLGPQSTAALTITDNDTQPILEFSSHNYSVGEGVVGGKATITVTRTGGSNAVSVGYATSTGSATAGSDYTATSGTLNFGVGETSKTFDVSILEDALDEADEVVLLGLSSPGGGAAIGTMNAAVLTITDNDAAPSLSINDVTVAETGGTATFNITLSAASGQTVTVNYTTANGTAIAPGDYGAVTAGSVTFNPGETSKPATVNIENDAADEPDETFLVNLSSPSNATTNDGTGIGTITDDDPLPSLFVGDVTVVEGNGGTTNAVFNVTLTPASGKTVTVNYTTADGTATAGSDYTAAGGTLTFNPGDTLQTVTVAVNGDTVDEANETFNVNLSGETNATVNDGQGVGTITDDDGAPSLSINDVTVTEGNAGDMAATFTVTLAPASGQTVTVNYASADGTATAGPDYGGTAGTLTFLPGETTKTVTVNAFGDTANEANETFFVNLSSATNATVSDSQGLGTILNDDAPTLHFAQASYPANESAHFVTVNVTRSGDSSGAVNVNFTTSDGTATERKDYTFVAGTLRFAAGETSKSFDVLLTEDAFQESDETINLTLSNPTGGAVLGAQATATVVLAADDNPPPAFNPIDISSDFVRQHYHDFLNREPDASGLAFWTGEIEQCGANAGCREVKRINVSAAFFLSIEFQETGYLVYRAFKSAYGDTTSPGVPGTVPVVRLNEFLPDTRRIGEGVVVGPGDAWKVLLEANKQAYFLEFVLRPRFTTAFPATLTPAQFVDALFSNAGVTPSATERQTAIDLFGGAATSADSTHRSRALRQVAEHPALIQSEFRRAFVLMQYYGYLRRNPDDAPERDLNFGGWAFWLGKLNENNGNYVRAEMVKAFLDASEYRNRFGN